MLKGWLMDGHCDECVHRSVCNRWGVWIDLLRAELKSKELWLHMDAPEHGEPCVLRVLPNVYKGA